MGTYKIKKHSAITWIGGFGLLSVFSLILFIVKGSYIPAITAFGFLGLAVIFGLGLSKAIIITNDGGIKKSIFGKLSQEYQWLWIYDIRTVHSIATGDYITTLSWAEEPIYRGTGGLFGGSKKNSKSGTFLVTSNVVDYSKLLKEIREKAPHSEIDSLTKEIISKGL